MREALSNEQVESYREHGFLVVEDFLDHAEVEWLGGVLAEAVEARGDARLPGDLVEAGVQRQASGGDSRPGTQPAEGRRVLEALGKRRPKWVRVLSQHVNLWQTDERIRQFSLDPRLGQVATQLADVDGVRIWHDQSMIKPVWGEPTGWHTDTPVFSFTHPGASTFWFALVDADLRNGCMHYIDGSHKGRVTERGNMRIDGLRLLKPEWEFAEPVACPVRAGAMIVHNGDTAHGAGANMTPRARTAFAISWMPLGSTFNGNPNILPADVLASLEPGDPLDLDDLNPVVYQRPS